MPVLKLKAWTVPLWKAESVRASDAIAFNLSLGTSRTYPSTMGRNDRSYFLNSGGTSFAVKRTITLVVSDDGPLTARWFSSASSLAKRFGPPAADALETTATTAINARAV